MKRVADALPVAGIPGTVIEGLVSPTASAIAPPSSMTSPLARSVAAKKDLIVAVSGLLTGCEKAGLANRTCDLDDPETGLIYAAVLEHRGIKTDTVRIALPFVLSASKFFPKPSELVELLSKIEADTQDERRRAWWRSLVVCTDDAGAEMMAPPAKVRNGRLLPPGDESGDGSPASPKPVPRRRRQRFRELEQKRLQSERA